ncbi:MAG: VapC toxin family PIN domain ribonuclease [Acidobacteria bacterium]|nr:MAG: VapC toxin family PIN domain ribonuclease [Acidobacteriota bacterium]
MILADTSVWVDHFRNGNRHLARSLVESRVLIHRWVISEIACGNLRHRSEVLGSMQKLPSATVADDNEVLDLIENRHLWGKGIGWVDAHLLASALLSGCRLWTLDRRLAKAAAALNVRY